MNELTRTNFEDQQIVEINAAEIDAVSGGVIPAIAYACFVSGAKWGAGIAVAVYTIKAKWD